MNIQHSNRSDEWLTPLDILAMARQVLGPIDFDPASSVVGNSRVQARFYFTEEIDALKEDWPLVRSVWLNPPGGKVGNKSKTALFWRKLMDYRALGSPLFGHAIFLAFSAEARQTTQGMGVPSIGAFPNCTPAKRIAFDRMDGTKGEAPSHSNCIVYVPGTLNETGRFIDVFSTIGTTR